MYFRKEAIGNFLVIFMESRLKNLFASDAFEYRHIGISQEQEVQMLKTLGFVSREEFISRIVPPSLLLPMPIDLPFPEGEEKTISDLRRLSLDNQVWRSYIGCGYYGTFLPQVIRRNVLENPGWYTAYTPYQAEISQGRLEALFLFQQMVSDLTQLPVANASLLDEATAVAEAMSMMRRMSTVKSDRFFVDEATHPQILSVLNTRAWWSGISIVVGDSSDIDYGDNYFGAYLPSPDTYGRIRDFSDCISAFHEKGVKVAVGCDLLALVLVKSPGAMGADIAVGTAQRFGIPIGYGGPHPAFLSARTEFIRSMPGRIIGLAKDVNGKKAFRMALQTREQHIRRDKATSNICTSQALLASMSAFYALYHGATGLAKIAKRVNILTRLLAKQVSQELSHPNDLGPMAGTLNSYRMPLHQPFFDTLVYRFSVENWFSVQKRCQSKKINLRNYCESSHSEVLSKTLSGIEIGISLDETSTLGDIADLIFVLTGTSVDQSALALAAESLEADNFLTIPFVLSRKEPVLCDPEFNNAPSETEFVRYLKKLENKDFSLVHSMIPLGSCTMKLNAAAEMIPLSWPEFTELHPFVPVEQAQGYQKLLDQLEEYLAEITGFSAVSFQPNSGAQGEYAGLLAIREYLASIGETQRDVCLIPTSAHGTNPASARMIGMTVVEIACDSNGNIDLVDFNQKIASYGNKIAALMVTYPSTHGVFEPDIEHICRNIHQIGAQVYLDGANLNAQVGLIRPASIGADVCHMNLHKTFCIPHGGGGPGMGPIAVAEHLAPFLPKHPFPNPTRLSVSGAPYSSASITTISWMYIRMMGAKGLRRATETAILNANYIAARLDPYFPVRYRGGTGYVAHECIIDLQSRRYGVQAQDVAKRLMDYGFHAPTLSFPVPDSLMIEPTESESKNEMDRFCDAMIAIHGELEAIRKGDWPLDDNPVTQAPHTAEEIAGNWCHGYSRDIAAYPLSYLRDAKCWPAVKRIDDASGDRSFVNSLSLKKAD